VWLLRLPLPQNARVSLPPRRHLFPWYFEPEETSRFAELLAGLLAGVDRHLVLPWPALQTLLSATEPPTLAATLLVLTLDDPSVNDATIDEALASIACPYVMLQVKVPRDEGYAWQEKYLKGMLVTLLQEQIADEKHPLAPLNIAALPVRVAASLTTDALGLIDLLEAAIEHRLAHAAQGTSEGHYEASLYAMAGRRFAERLLRLLPYQVQAAIDVLRSEGLGLWSDERFRAGAKALEEVGLAQVAGGSVSLGPIARRAKDPRILAVLRATLSNRLSASSTRRWIVETAPVLDDLRSAHATKNLVAFVDEAVSASAVLVHVLRGDERPAPSGPVEGTERVMEWIRLAPDFKEGCRRASDFLSDPERSQIVRTGRHSDYEVWIEVIKREFSEDEWKRINSIYAADRHYDEPVGAANTTAWKPDPRSTYRGFKVLSRTRFGSHDALARQVDALLEKRGDLRLDLARWMTFAFHENLIGETRAPFLDMISWVWMHVVDNPVEAYDARDEARGVMRRCLAVALKNGYELQRTHIEDDAKAIGLDVSTVVPAGERSSDFLELMKEGFERMLEGAFPDARQAYERAGVITKESGDVFAEWAAFQGEADAVWADIELVNRTKEASMSRIEDYRLRQLAREQDPKVKEWLELARERRERLTEAVIEAFVEERRERTVSARAMSFSNAAHDYWTMFRDLETIHAPPATQRKFVQPLIDLGGFDPETELHYRLQLGVDKAEKTDNWISRIIDDPQGTLSARRERDAKLLAEFRRADTTKFERVQRLAVFPRLAPILRREDLDWTPSFLTECKKELTNVVTTFASRRVLAFDHAEAWGAYANIESRAPVLDHLEAYVATIGGYVEAEGFSRQLRGLPLEQWVGLHEGAAQRLVRLCLGLDRSASAKELVVSDEQLAWALFSVVRGVQRFHRELPEPMWSDIRSWAAAILQKTHADDDAYLSSAFNAAAHLAWAAASGDSARDSVIEAALDRASRIPLPSYRKGPALEGSLGVWVALVEAGASPVRASMADAASTLWAKLDTAWGETLRFVKNNPHHGWPYVAFMAELVASGTAKPACVVRERLLQVVQAAPDDLALCALILDPRDWEDSWQPFVDLVWRFSGGGDGSDPLGARLGAIDMLRRWLVRPKRGSGELAPEFSFLVDRMLLGVLDESPAVANRAAYGVASYAARACSPADVQRVVRALRRMTVDPRLVVRGAAAYAGKKLPFEDISDGIHAAAQEIDASLSEDVYALIQRQRSFGELDGRVPTS
jgi:hypothetical protein